MKYSFGPVDSIRPAAILTAKSNRTIEAVKKNSRDCPRSFNHYSYIWPLYLVLYRTVLIKATQIIDFIFQDFFKIERFFM